MVSLGIPVESERWISMGRASDPSERKREAKYEASQRAAERFLERLAIRVEQLSRFLEDPGDSDIWIRSLQFKTNSGWDGGVMVIVKADIGGEQQVSFHSEPSLDECLVGLANRLANGTMKWREDVPYKERDAGK